MLKGYSAILNKRNWFSRFLHRHHDVEACGTDFVDAGLQLGIEHFNNAAPMRTAPVPRDAEIAEQFAEPLQPAQILVPIFLGKFDKQDCLGIAAEKRSNGRLEHRNLGGKSEHGAINKFDRDRSKLDDVLRRLHRLMKAAEM